MIGWFRVPTWIGGRRQGDRAATDAEAWVDLLGRWHQGEDISACALAAALQWGKGRTLAFMPKVAAWAKENGATLPASWAARVPDRSADQKRTDMRTSQNEEEAAQVASSGPESDRAADQDRTVSRARVPLSEKRAEPDQTRPEIRNMNMSPPPAAPLFAQPPTPEVAPPAAPAPKPKPPPADEAEALAVWAAWKETHRGCKATPPADVAKLIRAALKAHGAETVIAVVRWTQTADHSRARYLRGERNGQMVPKEAYGLDTIMRHVGSYDALRVADEAAPAASPRLSALPPGMKPRPVVIDAESGRVEEEPQPRPSTGSKRLDLMVSAAERLRRQREIEEEEERQQQEVQNAEV